MNRQPTGPPPSSQSSPTRRARGLVEVAVGCALGAILINTWIVEGLVAPIVVNGCSMAPALFGAHRTWQCGQCGHAFACNLESLPAAGGAAICPHCGAANDPETGVDAPGDRMLVDRSAFCWRRPRRWETVVVRSPDDPARLCVKRVVGLPGEVVAIVGGDVLVNGAVARKDLATLRAMALSVSGPEATDRWRPDDSEAWQFDDGWFVHDARESDSIDWLSYHHAEHAVRGGGAGEPAILDDSVYDQNESRRLNEVSDVMLRGEIRATGTGWCCVRASGRGNAFQLRLNVASGEFELAHNGREAIPLTATGNRPSETAQLEFVVADRRVQFSLSGKLLGQYDYEPDATPPDAAPHAWAVGVQGARVRVRNLEVLRDVYYTSGPGGGMVQYRLAAGEYFLLGDNSARSLDSRLWSRRQGVLEPLLVGRALAW